MIFLANSVLFAASLLALIPILIVCVECAAALLPARRREPESRTARPRIAVLIPAHDEAEWIAATLASLQPELTSVDRVLVVADNCNDDTAAIARASGATVIERTEPERQGKGYALEFGIEFVQSEYSDVVLILDADCSISPGAVDRIARLCFSTARPVQAAYVMEPPAEPSANDVVSAFAFLVKNWVRPAGLRRLGLPCLLTGSGMAFPVGLLEPPLFANGRIAEDMWLTADLALAGHFTLFCAEARITGRLPKQRQAIKSQRTRWEHGHLETAIGQAPRLVVNAIRRCRFSTFALALELMVPPLSLLVLLWAGLGMTSLFAGLVGIGWMPFLLNGFGGLALSLALGGAWHKFGRDKLPDLKLWALLLYVISKIPIYIGFLVRRQTAWIRTARDRPSQSHPSG